MMKNILLLVCYLFSSSWLIGQCEMGEVEIDMNLYTDAWGYEVYWELVPSGNECGDGTIIWGGNDLDVGCTGGGEQDAGGNGYDSNTVYELDAFCLTAGNFYDLIFVDDWGDGGLTFEIYEDENFSHLYVGGGTGNMWTFEAGNAGLPEYDSPCGASEIEIDGDALFMNNENAIAEINEVTPGGGNCALFGVWCEGATTNTIWATFVAEDEGGLFISSCNEGTNFDTQIALWKADDCGDWENFTLVSSNDDIGGGCWDGAYFASGMYASCLEEGSTYYIQIDGWAGAVGNVQLTVSSFDEDPELVSTVGNMPCALDKGADGTGSLQPYVYGWGADFSAEWTGPNDFSSEDNWIYNLEAGVYTVTITNACGDLSLTESWEITEPDPYDVSFMVIDSECPMSANGEIDIDVDGASPPFDYEWTGPDEFFSDEDDIMNLDAGQYSVIVTDDHGCVHEQILTLSAENSFSFSLGQDTTICEESEVFLHGPPGYSYEWQDESINQFFIVDGASLGFGTYSFVLHAYNEEGCEFTDGIIVTIDVCDNIAEYFAHSPEVFPNPSDGNFTLANLPAIANGQWQLFDATGRIADHGAISTSAGGSWSINTNQPAGIYTLKVNDGKSFGQSRIVIR